MNMYGSILIILMTKSLLQYLPLISMMDIDFLYFTM